MLYGYGKYMEPGPNPQADWSIAAWINPSVQPAQSGSYLLYKGSTDYGLFVAWLKWPLNGDDWGPFKWLFNGC